MNKTGVILVVAVFGLAMVLTGGPAWADWAGAAKWDQLTPLDPGGWGAASWVITPYGQALTADDFPCTSPDPIADIRFAGFGGDPAQFRITFWSDVPRTAQEESHPGGLLYDYTVGPASSGDPLKIGWQNLGSYQYQIDLPETQWFYQQGTPTNPVVYWIGIQGVSSTDTWYWFVRDRSVQTLGDDAAFESDYYNFPPWSHWGWPDSVNGPDLYQGVLPTAWLGSADMAFELTAPEPGTLALLAVGGLGVIGRAIRRRKMA